MNCLAGAFIDGVQTLRTAVAERLRPGQGHAVAQPYSFATSTGWQTFVLSQATVSLTTVAATRPLAPAAATLVGLQLVLGLKPDLYGLFSVGRNPEDVLRGWEWTRVATSPIYYHTWPQLVNTVASLYDDGSYIENRYGARGLLGALGALAMGSSSFYMFASWAAHTLAPASAPAAEYATHYIVGFMPICLGLKVLTGYDQDAARSTAGAEVWGERYRWGMRLWFARVFASPEYGPSTTALPCGVAAGLALVYAVGAAWPAWRRRAGLGWRDLLIQGALLGLAVGLPWALTSMP